MKAKYVNCVASVESNLNFWQVTSDALDTVLWSYFIKVDSVIYSCAIISNHASALLINIRSL